MQKRTAERSMDANSGCSISIWKTVGTANKIVHFSCEVARRMVAGSDLLSRTIVPPRWNMGVVRTFQPPAWKNGANVGVYASVLLGGSVHSPLRRTRSAGGIQDQHRLLTVRRLKRLSACRQFNVRAWKRRHRE